ncbi:MAG: hypothetical protein NVSMB22_17990 [Chloroflexota bacterium]
MGISRPLTEPPGFEGTGFDAVSLLGLRIDRLRQRDLVRLVTRAAAARTRLSVMYANVHCINVAQRDAEYARILNQADVVYCDGTGVRLGAALAGQYIPARMTGADWIDDLCRAAVQTGLSLYFVGGEAEVARQAADVLRRRYAGLDIRGCSAGYNLTPRLVDEINGSDADILLVGMGTPTQEKWIAHNRDRLDVPIVWAVGALFGFVSGQIPRGPRWMTAHGLEWVCRLWAEPRKLWRRYLLGNPAFVWRIVRTYWLGRR